MPMFLRRTHRIERSVSPEAVWNDEQFEILETGVLGSEERAARWDEALLTELGDAPVTDIGTARGTSRRSRP